MARYRATLAYDGTAYQGFQRQAEGIPTVQGRVEQAIGKVTQQPVTVIGAGRTDSGVHAEGQVIAFDCTWRHTDAILLRAINANLPQDIALQDIRQQPGFHPRFDAVARLYRYEIALVEQRQPLLWHRMWQVKEAVNVEAMREAAVMLTGTHDFATFGQPPQGDNTVRTVTRSEWQVADAPYGQHLTYHIQGNAFLYHMVRRIVGMSVKVGRGIMSLAEFEAAFHSADVARARALAPPQGLILEAVTYPNQSLSDISAPAEPIVLNDQQES